MKRLKEALPVLCGICVSSLLLCGYIAPQDRKYLDYFLKLYSAELFRDKNFVLVSSYSYVGVKNIEQIDMILSCSKPLGRRQARELIVNMIDDIILAINEDENLKKRGFLARPFTVDRLTLEIRTDNVWSANIDVDTCKTIRLSNSKITYDTYPWSTLLSAGSESYTEEYQYARMLCGKHTEYTPPKRPYNPELLPYNAIVSEENPVPGTPMPSKPVRNASKAPMHVFVGAMDATNVAPAKVSESLGSIDWVAPPSDVIEVPVQTEKFPQNTKDQDYIKDIKGKLNELFPDGQPQQNSIRGKVQNGTLQIWKENPASPTASRETVRGNQTIFTYNALSPSDNQIPATAKERLYQEHPQPAFADQYDSQVSDWADSDAAFESPKSSNDTRTQSVAVSALPENSISDRSSLKVDSSNLSSGFADTQQRASWQEEAIAQQGAMPSQQSQQQSRMVLTGQSMPENEAKKPQNQEQGWDDQNKSMFDKPAQNSKTVVASSEIPSQVNSNMPTQNQMRMQDSMQDSMQDNMQDQSSGFADERPDNSRTQIEKQSIPEEISNPATVQAPISSQSLPSQTLQPVNRIVVDANGAEQMPNIPSEPQDDSQDDSLKQLAEKQPLNVPPVQESDNSKLDDIPKQPMVAEDTTSSTQELATPLLQIQEPTTPQQPEDKQQDDKQIPQSQQTAADEPQATADESIDPEVSDKKVQTDDVQSAVDQHTQALKAYAVVSSYRLHHLSGSLAAAPASLKSSEPLVSETEDSSQADPQTEPQVESQVVDPQQQIQNSPAPNQVKLSLGQKLMSWLRGGDESQTEEDKKLPEEKTLEQKPDEVLQPEMELKSQETAPEKLVAEVEPEEVPQDAPLMPSDALEEVPTGMMQLNPQEDVPEVIQENPPVNSQAQQSDSNHSFAGKFFGWLGGSSSSDSAPEEAAASSNGSQEIADEMNDSSNMNKKPSDMATEPEDVVEDVKF